MSGRFRVRVSVSLKLGGNHWVKVIRLEGDDVGNYRASLSCITAIQSTIYNSNSISTLYCRLIECPGIEFGSSHSNFLIE